MLSAIAIVFVYGVIVGKFQVFPYTFIDYAYKIARNFPSKNYAALSNKYPVWIYPARYEGSGVVVHIADKAYSGVTLMSGYWNSGKKWFIGMDYRYASI